MPPVAVSSCWLLQKAGSAKRQSPEHDAAAGRTGKWAGLANGQAGQTGRTVIQAVLNAGHHWLEL